MAYTFWYTSQFYPIIIDILVNIEKIAANLNEANSLLTAFCADPLNATAIAEIAAAMAKCFAEGGHIYSIGNGGSMCDSMHFAEELSGRFKNDRPALPALAINDPAYISCVANDYDFGQIFSRAISAFTKKGDILLLFSTSGNSKNIVNAAIQAKEMGAIVIGLLGKDGGEVKKHCHRTIIIKSDNTARIQEIHIKIVHCLIAEIEQLMGFN